MSLSVNFAAFKWRVSQIVAEAHEELDALGEELAAQPVVEGKKYISWEVPLGLRYDGDTAAQMARNAQAQSFDYSALNAALSGLGCWFLR